jgi:hypothetical protein
VAGSYSRAMTQSARLGAIVSVAVTVFSMPGCSSETPAAPSSSAVFDAGRMDVHPSAVTSAEPSAEEGPEPGEEFASPPAATIPPGTRVPRIQGMDFEDAVITLRVLGMDFGFVVARASHEEPWTVLEQSPDPGGRPPHGGRVSMVVSIGPTVAGVAAAGGVACEPEEDDIDEPYCDGKILRY